MGGGGGRKGLQNGLPPRTPEKLSFLAKYGLKLSRARSIAFKKTQIKRVSSDGVLVHANLLGDGSDGGDRA